MPKVNTFNYDTIASWNGSQDLFVVEQPDGTKVATPAMVKQFIQAGDFAATGEIEDGHGNKLSGVVDIIGDLSQTGITGDSVADQLDNLKSELTPVYFQVTLSDDITNVRMNDQFNYYIPATGEVHLNFLIYSGDGNIPANNRIIATVPEAYKPRSNKQFLCELGDTSNQPVRGERGYVNTGGNIALNNFIYGDRAIQWVYLNYSYIR